MLVLSRQKDETIMIGDDVEITVVDIRGDKVRLGIKAPPHIPVHRKEVYEAIKRENREAAQVNPDDLKSLANSRGNSTQRLNTDPSDSTQANKPATSDSKSKVSHEPKVRRRIKPADSNTNSSNKIKNNTSGCEGTQPAGS